MKIGILTLPLHTNYGGLLQNYALQQVLQKMGYEAETINRKKKNLSFIEQILLWGRIAASRTIRAILHSQMIIPYSLTEEEQRVVRKNTDAFINKYIKKTNPIQTINEFRAIARSNRYDAYIVGSDQCWRSQYNSSFFLEMFLRFAKRQTNVKRIAYAVSFGTDYWDISPKMTRECAELAQKFDLITVREDSGINLCKQYLGVNATQVLDPTLLLNKEDYINICTLENEPVSQGDLFYYILDPNHEIIETIQSFGQNHNMQSFTVFPKQIIEHNTKQYIQQHLEEFVFPKVTSWVRAFIDAKMIIVDSFHGMVFSIIFNKPFWVIGNQRRGNARFESLLKLFGLEDRMISIEELQTIDCMRPIDWNTVNYILEKEKSRCRELIENALTL